MLLFIRHGTGWITINFVFCLEMCETIQKGIPVKVFFRSKIKGMFSILEETMRQRTSDESEMDTVALQLA